MKHILILEDEQRNANRLVRLLKEIVPEARIDGPLATIEAAAEYLRKAPAPDLILADIRLSDGLSFEALKEAPPAVPIVFTTAYDEYAVQAFKYNSFDYLLKPIDADELAAAIDKVGRGGRNTSDEPLRRLFEALQQGGCRYRERFLLPYRDGYKTVSVREINHISTENKIVRLHLNDGTSESVSVSMDELERQLDPARFFRANRQYIVCMENIRYLGNYFGGKLVLRLHRYPDAEIIVSKEKVQRLKEWIDRWSPTCSDKRFHTRGSSECRASSRFFYGSHVFSISGNGGSEADFSVSGRFFIPLLGKRIFLQQKSKSKTASGSRKTYE